MTEINTDPAVMEFFPGTKTQEETMTFIEKMQQQFAEKGFCYFAVDKLENNEFIGFIGLSEQTFEADFTPCIDVGWRLRQREWNKGFATEGAKRCLDYAFENLNLKKIYAIAPEINLGSVQIMKKIGMKKLSRFKHPLLAGNQKLETCLLYGISADGPHRPLQGSAV